MSNEQRRKERMEEILEGIRRSLPEVLYRNDSRFFSLVGLKPETVKRHDIRKCGPAARVRSGRTVGYPRNELVDYLRRRMELEFLREEKREESEAA